MIIKATAGGGGRNEGCKNRRRDGAGLYDCQSEGKAAFGNDEVYIEKYLTTPRHIEIQVFGNGKGTAVHLGEEIAHYKGAIRKFSKKLLGLA